MGSFQLSSKAETDLIAIADYTIENFGIRQSRIYKNELIACLNSISNAPNIGKQISINKIQNLHVFPFKAHHIFYQKTQEKIIVIRILGSRMDFERHL